MSTYYVFRKEKVWSAHKVLKSALRVLFGAVEVGGLRKGKKFKTALEFGSFLNLCLCLYTSLNYTTGSEWNLVTSKPALTVGGSQNS